MVCVVCVVYVWYGVCVCGEWCVVCDCGVYGKWCVGVCLCMYVWCMVCVVCGM